MASEKDKPVEIRGHHLFYIYDWYLFLYKIFFEKNQESKQKLEATLFSRAFNLGYGKKNTIDSVKLLMDLLINNKKVIITKNYDAFCNSCGRKERYEAGCKDSFIERCAGEEYDGDENVARSFHFELRKTYSFYDVLERMIEEETKEFKNDYMNKIFKLKNYFIKHQEEISQLLENFSKNYKDY
ncbi:MAG: hypothetical protein QXL88_00195 [Candidatus Pacearchaeota archaeon]